MALASLSPPLLPFTNLQGINRRVAVATASPRRAGAGGAELRTQRPWWAALLSTVLGEKRAVGERQLDQEKGKVGAAKRARLTAEKARVLRREMRVTESWHDAMYHSAIASRLASLDQP